MGRLPQKVFFNTCGTFYLPGLVMFWEAAGGSSCYLVTQQFMLQIV